MRKIVFNLFVLFSLMVSAQDSETYAYVTLSADAFIARLKADPSIQLVDVRTPEEYAEGRIGGAVNIDVRDSCFVSDAVGQLDKSRPVAVYCKGGVRSRNAARQLSSLGFKVYNLDKGYDSVDASD